jgi:hypothetical protein
MLSPNWRASNQPTENEMSNEKLAVVGGKWIIPAEHADRKIGSSTNKQEDKSNYAHLICNVQGKYQDNEANARRLVACWNACDGFGTNMLESVVVAGDTLSQRWHGMHAAIDEQQQKAADLKVELAHAKEANQALLAQLGAMRVLLTQVVELYDAGCIVSACDGHETETALDILAERIRAILTP